MAVEDNPTPKSGEINNFGRKFRFFDKMTLFGTEIVILSNWVAQLTPNLASTSNCMLSKVAMW